MVTFAALPPFSRLNGLALTSPAAFAMFTLAPLPLTIILPALPMVMDCAFSRPSPETISVPSTEIVLKLQLAALMVTVLPLAMSRSAERPAVARPLFSTTSALFLTISLSTLLMLPPKAPFQPSKTTLAVPCSSALEGSSP